MATATVKRCKNPRCNKKFKTIYPDKVFCHAACESGFEQAKPNEFLKGKRVLYLARGVREDGLHPNERRAIPKQSFVVETPNS